MQNLYLIDANLANERPSTQVNLFYAQSPFSDYFVSFDLAAAIQKVKATR